MMPKGLALERLKQEAKREYKRERYAKHGSREQQLASVIDKIRRMRPRADEDAGAPRADGEADEPLD